MLKSKDPEFRSLVSLKRVGHTSSPSTGVDVGEQTGRWLGLAGHQLSKNPQSSRWDTLLRGIRQRAIEDIHEVFLWPLHAPH